MEREIVAQKILVHLGTLPEREDTFEGITNWWLMSDKGERAIDEVREALKLLIGKGEIDEVKGSKEVVRYRAKKKTKDLTNN